jgi:hypothetical protein
VCNSSLLGHELLCLHLRSFYGIESCSSAPKTSPCADERKKPARNLAIAVPGAFGSSGHHECRCHEGVITALNDPATLASWFGVKAAQLNRSFPAWARSARRIPVLFRLSIRLLLHGTRPGGLEKRAH